MDGRSPDWRMNSIENYNRIDLTDVPLHMRDIVRTGLSGVNPTTTTARHNARTIRDSPLAIMHGEGAICRIIHFRLQPSVHATKMSHLLAYAFEFIDGDARLHETSPLAIPTARQTKRCASRLEREPTYHNGLLCMPAYWSAARCTWFICYINICSNPDLLAVRIACCAYMHIIFRR